MVPETSQVVSTDQFELNKFSCVSLLDIKSQQLVTKPWLGIIKFGNIQSTEPGNLMKSKWLTFESLIAVFIPAA